MVIVVSARSVQSCTGLSRNGLIGYLPGLGIRTWMSAKARRMAICSAGPVWETVAFLHQFVNTLLEQGFQGLQKAWEVRETSGTCCVDEPRG